MIKLRCVVEHITYQNQENGWSVMKVKVKGYDNLVTLTGSLLDVPVGSVLLVDGDWRVDPKYGQQFVAQSWTEVISISNCKTPSIRRVRHWLVAATLSVRATR